MRSPVMGCRKGPRSANCQTSVHRQLEPGSSSPAGAGCADGTLSAGPACDVPVGPIVARCRVLLVGDGTEVAGGDVYDRTEEPVNVGVGSVNPGAGAYRPWD